MAINQFSPKPSKVLFVDEQYIKETTEIPDNVDTKLFRTSIQYMQDKYILPILGNNIFEQMKQQIASGATLSGNATAYLEQRYLYILENWIQPVLAAAVMMEAVYKINIQIRNKGLMQARGEYSSNATDKQVDWLSENYRETAAFYAQRLTQFLCDNVDIYPNYLNVQMNSAGSGAALFYPQKTKYFCGIHLPGGTNSGSFGPGSGWGLSLYQKIELFGNVE